VAINPPSITFQGATQKADGSAYPVSERLGINIAIVLRANSMSSDLDDNVKTQITSGDNSFTFFFNTITPPLSPETYSLFIQDVPISGEIGEWAFFGNFQIT
jgi:hypothetical protein